MEEKGRKRKKRVWNMKEGILYINNDGRYAISNFIYFTCGDNIEIEINGTWVETRIEAKNSEYYAVGLEGLNLVGKKARVKI